CMNGREGDPVSFDDLKDHCGNHVSSGDDFILYNETNGNYFGLAEQRWLTLITTGPAGFFWQVSSSNSDNKYLKSTVGGNCAVQSKAWIGHNGRYLAADKCNGGSSLEFRKWVQDHCWSDQYYQISL
ncbi:hypothetical protein BGW38_001422, partial [Lunasporangiospora selenospora]